MNSSTPTSAPTRMLRLGTRGSLLARTQSQLVADELQRRHPGLKVELIVYKTSGDQIAERPLHEFGGKGLFTKELEQALLDGAVDFAVHSFKDVPVTMPLVEQTGLVFAAVPPREDVRDVLVSPQARHIADLPREAKVGTGSLRRRSQLLVLRPDLQVELVRGNIDTRLKKLRSGQFAAILLAMAGLRRAGLFDPADMTAIEPEELLPAPGQGALAIQCRSADAQTRELLGVMDDPTTRLCVEAERAVVAQLQGDCHSPIAALAQVHAGALRLRAAVGGCDGTPPVIRAEASGPVDQAQQTTAAVLESLARQNVHALLRSGGR